MTECTRGLYLHLQAHDAQTGRKRLGWLQIYLVHRLHARDENCGCEPMDEQEAREVYRAAENQEAEATR